MRSVAEVIIHPRIQRDFYKYPIRWEGLELAVKQWERTGSGIPICYNGEIHSLAEYRAFRQRFPQIQRVMLGRGVLKNPFLAGQLRRWEQGRHIPGDAGDDKVQEPEADAGKLGLQSSECCGIDAYGEFQDSTALGLRRKVLWNFHQELLDGYRKMMSEDRNALFRMKELWTYFGESFPGKEKALKKIRKAGNMAQYEAAVREVFDSKP